MAKEIHTIPPDSFTELQKRMARYLVTLKRESTGNTVKANQVVANTKDGPLVVVTETPQTPEASQKLDLTINPQRLPNLEALLLDPFNGKYPPGVPTYRQTFPLSLLYQELFAWQFVNQTTVGAKLTSTPQFFKSGSIPEFLQSPFDTMLKSTLTYMSVSAQAWEAQLNPESSNHRAIIDHLKAGETENPKILSVYKITFLIERTPGSVLPQADQQTPPTQVDKRTFAILLISGKFPLSIAGEKEMPWETKTRLIAKQLGVLEINTPENDLSRYMFGYVGEFKI